MIAKEKTKPNSLASARFFASIMNGDPRTTIAIAKKARELLRDVPYGKEENTSVLLVAKYTRNQLRKLYSTEWRDAAVQEANEINCLINMRKPTYVSIH